ncbi:hypothetical protein D3C80_1486150 [compost metagenome]
MTAFTSSSIRAISSSVSGALWLKSKRMRSASTIWPFWATCGPSTFFSAACSRWAAEWLARVVGREPGSTVAVTVAPTVRAAPWATWTA